MYASNYTWEQLHNDTWNSASNLKWSQYRTGTLCLLKHNNRFYTYTNTELILLDDLELSAELFRIYGVNELPNKELFQVGEDYKLLVWNKYATKNSGVSITATPIPQIIDVTIDMYNKSIYGIKSINGSFDGDVQVSYSYDNIDFTDFVDMQSFLDMDVDILYNNADYIYIKFKITGKESCLRAFNIEFNNQEV